MDIFEATRVILRWWFIAIPLFILTFVGAIVGTNGFPPEYTTNASILFVGPTVVETADNELEAVNPLLNQSSALTTAAVVTSLSIAGPQVADILSNEDLSTAYEVGTESRSPILLLQVRAESRELATATALRLVELVETDVRLRQDAANVPENQRVTTSLIGVAAVGGADYGSQTRARLALIAVGFVISGGIIFLLEGVSRRRANRTVPDGERDEGGDRSPET